MRRRSLLAATGAALAAGPASGCLAPASTGTGPTGDGYVVSGFDVSASKVAPTERYLLQITSNYSTSAVEREDGDPTVRDVSEIDDPEVRAAIQETLSEGELWRDEIPDGLEALTREVDFFTREANADPGDTYTHWGVAVDRAQPDRDPVVEFSADLVDDRVGPDDPGAIVFSLTNAGDESQTVFSGTVPPFSMLWAEDPASDDDRALLWREYAEEGCVGFGTADGDPAIWSCAVGVNTPIEPGETIERRYELHQSFDRDALAEFGFDAPGRYVVAETLGFHQSDSLQGPRTSVEWEVAFDLEER